MKITKRRHGLQAWDEYKAEVPYLQRPQIVSQKKIDGIRYFKCREGKLYEADSFIKMWGTNEKGEVKGKFYKGENPNQLLNK